MILEKYLSLDHKVRLFWIAYCLIYVNNIILCRKYECLCRKKYFKPERFVVNDAGQ